MGLNEEQLAAATHPQGEAALLLAGAGSGKCLGPKVMVLLYDGTTKQAQHVRNGDTLIGPDGQPRRVSGVTSGTEEMFEVVPIKGESWTCNRSHILSLYVSSKHKQRTYGEFIELTVDDYLRRADHFKDRIVKLWRAPLIEFPEKPVGVDPWFLGLWLGDGHSDLSTTSVSTMDSPVVERLRTVATHFGLGVTVHDIDRCPRYNLCFANGRASQLGREQCSRNPLSQAMRDLGLHNNKHIPHEYLHNSASVRRAVLAGLIDADGHLHGGCVEITTKFPQLALDILHLARSLGLAAYRKIKSVRIAGRTLLYDKIHISGEMAALPVVLPHKRPEQRKQIKSVRVTGFKVHSLGVGPYNGFTVDRDGLFLLGDFTVTHNTTTATHRISWLISEGVPSRKILALTFTNKAAGEIRERVLKATGLTVDLAPRLTTIHALALSLIRRNPQGFGLGAKITPLNDYDQNDLLKRIVTREEPELNPYNLRDKIEYHRARGIGFVEDYTDEVHDRALRAYAGSRAIEKDELKVWKKFQAEKLANSTLDFTDMLHFVNRRAINDPEWLVKLRGVFAHVLLDEAQDTSVVAWDLINNLLGPDNRNLFATGDISQSIMSFNGSSPELILQFAESWRGAQPNLYRLVRNHRSVPEVVNFANAVQEKMTLTSSLPLKMESFRGLNGEKGWTRLLRANTPYEVARRIAQQISDSPRPLRDYAILVRTSMQVREIEGELVRQRIPYIVRGGHTLLQTEEVRDVLSYLRFATNTKDFAALSRASSAPKRGMGEVALENVRRVANESFSGDLLQACTAAGARFASFADTVRAIQGRINNPVGALETTINLTEYVAHIRRKYAKDRDKIETKTENLARLRMVIEGLAAESNLTTEDLVFQLTLDKTEKDDERGVVTISTIHSAKGLEWNVVYVSNVVESSLPHWRSTGSADELDEERRLFYVAVTRARDNCTLCIPERVQRGQYLSAVEQSRFLTELGIEDA